MFCERDLSFREPTNRSHPIIGFRLAKMRRGHTHTHTHKQLQVSLHKRAINHRALLRKKTYQDMCRFGSTKRASAIDAHTSQTHTLTHTQEIHTHAHTNIQHTHPHTQTHHIHAHTSRTHTHTHTHKHTYTHTHTHTQTQTQTQTQTYNKHT